MLLYNLERPHLCTQLSPSRHRLFQGLVRQTKIHRVPSTKVFYTLALWLTLPIAHKSVL